MNDSTQADPSGHLGNTEVIDAPQVRGPETAVWPLMRWLWDHSSLDGLKKCHRVRFGPNVEVYVSEDGRVYFGGYCRCHSVWACPMCATVIRAARAAEMGGGLRLLLADGGGCIFSTYTVPHGQWDSLADLFDAVSRAWDLVRKDRTVRAFRKAHGLEFSRSTEVTFGDNGPHPHLHVGEVCSVPLTRDEVLEYRAACFSAWCRAVVSMGLRPPSDRYGLTMVRADAGMADYSHKVEGLASELFRMDRKTGKTRAPFEVLRLAVAGDVRAAAIWRDYEQVTRGRRMLGQSRGFKRVCRYDEAAEADLLDPSKQSGLVLAGTLRPDLSHLLTYHPAGFEGFAEIVGPGTPEAWQAACYWLTGTAPLYLSAAGWAVMAAELTAEPEYVPDSIEMELF